MPVHPRDLDGVMVVIREPAEFGHPGDDRKESYPDRYMKSMETSHSPVKKPKDLRLLRQSGLKVPPGPQVLAEISMIFQTFDGQKTTA